MSLHQQMQRLPLTRTQLARGVRFLRQPHNTPPPLSTSRNNHFPQHISKPIPRPQARSFGTSKRHLTNNTPDQSSPNDTAATTITRLDRVLARLPSPLQKYTSRLRSAPVSHIVAFLILHELTAIIPLLALFGLFHYAASPSSAESNSGGLIPIGYMLEHYGGYVQEGVAKFERYFTRKGWFGFGEGDGGGGGDAAAATAAVVGQAVAGAGEEQGKGAEAVLRRWESSDGRYRILVEIAIAYALTKALLPVRVAASVWATPWFAGVLGRLRKIVKINR